jgi:MFS family permease
MNRDEPVRLRDGFGYVLREKKLLYSIIAVSFLAMWGQDMQFTSALMAKNVFQGSALGFGMMGTVLALGAIFGAISFAKRKTLPSIELLTQRAFYMSGIWLLVAIAPNYWAYLVALFGAGYFSMGVNISGNGGIRTYAAPEFYGRAWGIYIFIWQSLIALGGILLGALADNFSVRFVISFGAFMALMMSVVLKVKFRAPEYPTSR